jgi:hypothetical protein
MSVVIGESFRLDLGDRVELHPATDAWISGDRFGEVVKIGRRYIHVHMDRSGRVRRTTFANISKRLGPSGSRTGLNDGPRI